MIEELNGRGTITELKGPIGERRKILNVYAKELVNEWTTGSGPLALRRAERLLEQQRIINTGCTFEDIEKRIATMREGNVLSPNLPQTYSRAIDKTDIAYAELYLKGPDAMKKQPKPEN